ncbi:MAG: RIP metalloprotease RseP [Patescibacteria group bacterium]
MVSTIIIFILVLSVLIFAHELGHFFTARRFGVKVEEFGFGFPPRAVGWYKNRYGHWRKIVGDRSPESLAASEDEKLHPANKAVIYSINWLPIGGFVKIKGENGEEKEENDSFASKSIGRRIVILAAGVIMNVILAWFLISVGYLIGLPQSTETLAKNARISTPQVVVAQVITDSPAASAGLKEGDAILRINNITVGTEKALQDAVAASAGQEVELLINRTGQEQIIKVIPVSKDGERVTMGVAIFAAGLVHYPFFTAFWEGAKTVGWFLGEIFTAFYDLFKNIFSGHKVSDQFAGPVGIATITGQAADLGLSYLLQFVALLSLNLAVLNILPFPALDGGRILFLLIEKIKGKPVRREVEALIHNIGFFLLIALVIFITYKDIIKLF